MRTWRRAEPTTPHRQGALVFLILLVPVAVALTFLLVTRGGQWSVNPIVGILIVYGWLPLLAVLSWRRYRTGIYVSEQAVRVVYLWGSRIVAWADVAEVTSRPARFLGRPTARDAVVLKLTDGNEVETPVQRRPDILTSSSGSINVGPVLDVLDFDATLSFLREYAAARSASDPRS